MALIVVSDQATVAQQFKTGLSKQSKHSEQSNQLGHMGHMGQQEHSEQQEVWANAGQQHWPSLRSVCLIQIWAGEPHVVN